MYKKQIYEIFACCYEIKEKMCGRDTVKCFTLLLIKVTTGNFSKAIQCSLDVMCELSNISILRYLDDICYKES